MLTITVTGTVGSGKTSVARYIQKSLQGLGFKVYLEDDDYVPSMDVNLLRKLVAIVQHPEHSNIQIVTKQSQRNPVSDRKFVVSPTGKGGYLEDGEEQNDG